jgi:hypothetical protein
MKIFPDSVQIVEKDESGKRRFVIKPIDDFIKPKSLYKLGICIPHMRQVHAEFARDLANTIATVADAWVYELKRKEPLGIMTFWDDCSILPMKRSELCKAALQANCSHVFFIDTDMTWNPRHVARALSWDLPIVAANCTTKTFPAVETAADFDMQRVATNYEDQHLQQVMQVGTAWMLLNTDVLKAMSYPYFQIHWRNDEWLGEDMYFCRMAMEEAQAPIFIDHEISKHVKHIGEFHYSHAVNWDLKAAKDSPDADVQALFKLCTQHQDTKNGTIKL